MKVLNKAEILSAQDITKEIVEVPEWGADAAIYVRVMDAKSRDTFEKRYNDPDKANKDESYRALVASLTICDDAGNLLFTVEDIEALAKKNWKVMNRIYYKAIDINALTQAAKEELKKS